MTLYTNLTPKETVRNALLVHAQGINTLNVASAFFDAHEDIIEVARRDIHVNLVVRLNEGTSVQSLKKLLDYENINIRYYTDRKFHPKVYIFGDRLALIGSANATNAGINSNSEVSVTIERQHPDFDNLVSLFSLYWENAMPLTAEAIKNVEGLFNKLSSLGNTLEDDIEKALGGKVSPPSGIVVTKVKKTKERTYISDYERGYQDFRAAFNKVYAIYLKLGKRKPESKDIPLRIEIDQLWNYIRDELTKGDSYKQEPLRHGEDLEYHITATIEKWLMADFPYLQRVITNYKIINEKFSSPEAINKLSPDELFDTLGICHSFRDNMRYLGTWEEARKAFLADVDIGQLREAVCYLLYDRKDRFTVRLAECLFGDYKIKNIGRSGYQELLGWVNQEDIPICNERTLIALRYLGIEGRY